jgi:hypothetical protein
MGNDARALGEGLSLTRKATQEERAGREDTSLGCLETRTCKMRWPQV